MFLLQYGWISSPVALRHRASRLDLESYHVKHNNNSTGCGLLNANLLNYCAIMNNNNFIYIAPFKTMLLKECYSYDVTQYADQKHIVSLYFDD